MSNHKSTEQLNLRMPKELLDDLELLSDLLKVNKSEWIKIKLSELVHHEKSRLIEQYVQLEKKGIVNKKDIKNNIKKLIK